SWRPPSARRRTSRARSSRGRGSRHDRHGDHHRPGRVPAMTVTDLIERVRSYTPTAPVETIQKAYEFSAEVHQGQRRLSGEPYLTHPLQVAGIIADMRLDVPSIATGLLHDTVEDTLTTLEQIESSFGAEIAALVDGVTKIGKINFTSREEKQAENFRKMLLAMARDIRVILIKLADR